MRRNAEIEDRRRQDPFALSELLRCVEVVQTRGSLNRSIQGIASHAAAAGPSHLFVAVPGTRRDGHEFAREAVERGAAAVIVERFLDELPARVAQIRVQNARTALARVAANFHGHPSRRVALVGITGTNGKTTTAYLLESVLRAAGLNVGVLGTIEYRYAGRRLAAQTTTPDSLDLQSMLREMAEAGVTHVVMEVTSHGLDQHRVEGCVFQVGAFTNLSRDHLDYHGDMHSYLKAKIRLFEEYLLPGQAGGFAVIHSGDPASAEIEKHCRGRTLRFGEQPDADFRPVESALGPDGTRLTLRHPDGLIELFSPLIGRPNLLNAMAACACAWALGVEPPAWKKGLADLQRVPGRFEPISAGSGPTVVVDYAHTPDALERVLSDARKLTHGRLVCVFGCGGNRDRGKRPLMARAAAEHSDLVIITSDNPRDEPPLDIITEIEQGLAGLPIQRISIEGKGDAGPLPAYTVLEDRAEAIRRAILWAGSGDLVLIAGKGHEAFQIVGDRRIPMDDRAIARDALREAAGVSEP